MSRTWKLSTEDKKEVMKRYKAGERTEAIATDISANDVRHLAHTRGFYRRKQRSHDEVVPVSWG